MGIFDGVLLCSDWDGTLFWNGDVNERNISAIRHFTEEGGKFAITSGRAYPFLENYSTLVKSNTYSITLNGAWIIDIDNKETLYAGFLDSYVTDIIDKITEFTDDFESITIYYKDEADKVTIDFKDYEKERERIKSNLIYKILLVSKNESTVLKTKNMLQSFDTKDYVIARSWAFSLEILKEENAKGAAVRRLKEALGSKLLVCVGDFENDILMLQAADISYATENGIDEVKRVASRTTVHARDGAIAKIIEDLEQEL